MIQDLHSHTYYSFCGKDTPDQIVKTAIACGIDTLGISDHNYGVGLQHRTYAFPDPQRRARHYQRALDAYLDHLRLIQAKYSDQIRILCGLEIATLDVPNWDLPDSLDISGFDYCLIESLGSQDSTMDDLFSFAKRCGCSKIGIAHTDVFTYLASTNQDPLDYFCKMADFGIFWELNVNYDSIHHYRQHQYVFDFFNSPEQQSIIRRSGVKLSVGFDCHRVEDYRSDIIKEYCEKLDKLELPMVFDV